MKNLFKNLAVMIFACLIFSSCDSSTDNETEVVTDEVTSAPKAVYVLSNSATANAVLTYTRSEDGTLSYSTSTATGGSGSGTDLPGVSQSLYFDPFTQVLYAVNTGSNSISAFYLQTDGSLVLLDTENSQGVRPVSLTVAYDVIYVVNQGDATTPASISGFRLADGKLSPIGESVQPLSAALPDPAQIQFTSTPSVVVVSERGTDSFTSFPLNSNGAAYAPNNQPSLGVSPGGMSFTPAGMMVVAEAQADVANLGSASTYVVGGDGTLVTQADQVGNGETGATSVKMLSNALFCFVTNSGSNSISTYQLGSSGGLSVLGEPISTEDGPVDLATSDDEAFLYALNRDSDSISIYSLNRDTGKLSVKSTLSDLPASAVGLAAR